MALSLHFELSTEDLGDAPLIETHPAMTAFRGAGGAGPLWARSPIPQGRGLGFSGAARVAGLIAAQPDARYEDVLGPAAELEGHADNVAASLFGGVVAATANRAVRVPLALDPMVVAWVPPTKTATESSRRALPDVVSRDDAVFNIGHAAMLVAALASGEIGALRDATQDRLHQDARFASAEPSRHALDHLLAAGAWCGWLSGSGPTVVALCSGDTAEAIAAAPPDGGAVKLLRIDHAGAVIEPGR